MKKLYVKSVIASLVVSLLFMLVNIYVTKLMLYFVVAFFIIFLALGFMIFLGLEAYLIDKEKKMLYPLALLIEGMLLIEDTGIIMTGWRDKTESIFTIIVWNVLFVGMFVTTCIGSRLENE